METATGGQPQKERGEEIVGKEEKRGKRERVQKSEKYFRQEQEMHVL